MNIMNFLFYIFSSLLIICAFMVIVSRQPVSGVLFLVAAFFLSALLWMMLEAEFLALVLIFVYVGAVMTLFLFVVMMLNLESSPKKSAWVKYLPFGGLVVALLLAVMAIILGRSYFDPQRYAGIQHSSDYSNVTELGALLYTKYFYAFELAAVLLLVAIVAAIALAFRRHRHSRSQTLAWQHGVRPQDRLQLVNPSIEKE